MLLAYLDESYQPGGVYWLAAALIPERAVDELGRAVRTIPKTIPADFGVPSDAELHGYDLYGGEGEFKPIKRKPDQIIRLYRKGLRALTQSEPALFFVGVEWSTSQPRASVEAHRLHVFSLLLPLLEQECAQRDERCILLADREETTEEDVIAAIGAHREACYAEHAACRLLEAVFVESRDCAGVQATDLACYAFRRRESGIERDERAKKALDGFYEIFAPHIAAAVRHPEPDVWPVATLDEARAAKAAKQANQSPNAQRAAQGGSSAR